MKDDFRLQSKELEEIHRQTEEDVDTEISAIDSKYAKRLQISRDEGLRIKGENGIMRKKFITLQKEIDDMKNEKDHVLDDQKKLRDITQGEYECLLFIL